MADGSHRHLLVRQGNSPAWSPDGRQIAFVAAADGVSKLRTSLLKVLKTREADVMPVIRYDVQGERGPFQPRYWVITNTPILGEDGYVRWIINRAEDVTLLEELRREAAKR